MNERLIDPRRKLIVPGDKETTIEYATKHWIECAQTAIRSKGYFCVALSGGSTPKAIFQKLVTTYKGEIDWNNVYLFWSDERSVPPTDPESNFHMAMEASGLNTLPFYDIHIFRMEAEKELVANARRYERHIDENVTNNQFDLIMLGMGDDGHTASLFPHTKALHEEKALVVANEVPQKQTWRMTFTYPLINQAKKIAFYVLGDQKKEMLKKVLAQEASFEELPSWKVGTETSPALWICDDKAAAML